MSDFNHTEEKILNCIQQSIPLVKKPFEVIGYETGLTEKEVLDTIVKLKNDKVIRNIAGIFDGKRLGYYMSLVAISAPEDRVEEIASFISSHPGVSHNYLRSNYFNIWFTLAEENKEKFDQSLEIIKKNTGVDKIYPLLNEKFLKIGVKFPAGKNEMKIPGYVKNKYNIEKKKVSSQNEIISEKEKKAIYLLQKDIPLTSTPFKKLSEENDNILTEDELIKIGNELIEKNIMRRYSAVIKHRKAGYTHNAMTCWKIDGEDKDFTKKINPFLSETLVSHLYLRTVYPGIWEHPLFAMLHSKSEDDLKANINRLSKESGLKDYLVLTTKKEFKKKRVIYFSDEFREWREKND